MPLPRVLPRLLTRSLTAAALLLGTACTLTDPTPPIPGAQLWVSPQDLTLRPGEDAGLVVELRGAPPAAAGYDVSVSGGWQGVQVSPPWLRLGSNDRALLRVSAGRTAPASAQPLYIRVSDGQGRGLLRVVQVRVRPLRAQPAPVQWAPVGSWPGDFYPAPTYPVPTYPTPVQPAPVAPVPLLP